MKREVEQKQERTACHSFAQSIEKKLPKPLNTCTLMLLHHCVENPKPNTSQMQKLAIRAYIMSSVHLLLVMI